MIGKVKWFNSSKGYGFIECEKGDVFCHWSAITHEGFKDLVEGQDVEFDLVDGAKGLDSRNIRVVK